MSALLARILALPAGENPVPELARRRAEAALERTGLPGRHNESWKYTALAALDDLEPAPPVRRPHAAAEALLAAAVDLHLGGALPDHRLVFCDGVYCPWLSRLPSGARFADHDSDFVIPEAGADDPAEAIVRLALARATVAWCLNVSAPAEIHVLHLGDAPAISFGRIALAAGAACTWIEHHLLAGGGLANHHHTVALAAGSRFEHLRFAPLRAVGITLQRTAVEVAAGAHYRLHSVTGGARLARHEVRVSLAGESAACALHTANILVAGQADEDWTVVHRAPRTAGTQTFRAVAGRRGRAVCSARSLIPAGVTGGDTRQTLHGLLLDAAGEIQLRPVLDIENDEVSASHGAGVGYLDAEALYYLQSRGLPAAEARRLLIAALLDEALARDLPDHLKNLWRGALERGAPPIGNGQ